MSRFRLAAACLLLLPLSADAQQPEASQQSPGILVVSAQKCRFSAVAELSRHMREVGAPILNEIVKEGRLTSWGLLEHAWGDEWNLVVYYSARDLNTFQQAYGDYFARLVQRDPQIMQKLDEACSEHKDNIYRIVMTNATTQ